MTLYTVNLQQAPQAPQPIGTLACDAGHVLDVHAAAPAHEAWLRDLVQRVNEMPTMAVDVPPPPGAARFSRHSVSVERTDAAFRAALKDFLQRFYGLQLVADGPEEEGELLDAGAPEPAPTDPLPDLSAGAAEPGARGATATALAAQAAARAKAGAAEPEARTVDEFDTEAEPNAPPPPPRPPRAKANRPGPHVPPEPPPLAALRRKPGAAG